MNIWEQLFLYRLNLIRGIKKKSLNNSGILKKFICVNITYNNAFFIPKSKTLLEIPVILSKNKKDPHFNNTVLNNARI